LPVGDTITNCKTYEVWLKYGIVAGVLGVVRIDSLGEVRHIDSGVRLTSNVEFVTLILGEFSVPLEDGGQVVIS